MCLSLSLSVCGLAVRVWGYVKGWIWSHTGRRGESAAGVANRPAAARLPSSGVVVGLFVFPLLSLLSAFFISLLCIAVSLPLLQRCRLIRRKHRL